MRLTSRSEYALLALVYLARNEKEGYIAVHTIGSARDIPPKFLDLAPTVALLLGFDMPGAEGTALEGALLADRRD